MFIRVELAECSRAYCNTCSSRISWQLPWRQVTTGHRAVPREDRVPSRFVYTSDIPKERGDPHMTKFMALSVTSSIRRSWIFNADPHVSASLNDHRFSSTAAREQKSRRDLSRDDLIHDRICDCASWRCRFYILAVCSLSREFHERAHECQSLTSRRLREFLSDHWLLPFVILECS